MLAILERLCLTRNSHWLGACFAMGIAARLLVLRCALSILRLAEEHVDYLSVVRARRCAVCAVRC